MEQLNFDNQLKLVQKEINHCLKRNILALGKLQLWKVYFSQNSHIYFFLFQNLVLNGNSNLKKMLYNFIWRNKIDKISRNTLQLYYKKVGSRVTNVEIFIKYLRLTWTRRLLTTNSSWIGIFSEITGCHTNKLCHFGTEYWRQRANATRNNFWQETLFYFCEHRDR